MNQRTFQSKGLSFPEPPGLSGRQREPLSGEDMVVCRDVWKVYGEPNAIAEVVRRARNGGIDRQTAAGLGCVVAVGGVSFVVRTGEIFCIMGLSGSGKSTLLRHVNRLIEPTIGTIAIAGEDIGVKSEAALRTLRANRIGMVFQDMALWPHMTVRRNVAYGLEIKGEPLQRRNDIADDLLELVKLSEWGDRYPDELSGGMRQRVGLARALATQPDLLLLDEPFSALDPLIRQQLQTQFLNISELFKTTAIFITHDLGEAIRIGHRIAIMKDGRFIQVGTPQEIVLSPRDDYVREFVRGIPRLGLVEAGAIMEPLPTGMYGETENGNGRHVTADTSLDTLISIGSAQTGPVIVGDGAGKPIGFISQQRLLRAVRDAL